MDIWYLSQKQIIRQYQVTYDVTCNYAIISKGKLTDATKGDIYGRPC